MASQWSNQTSCQSDGKDSVELWIIASTSRSQDDWEFPFNGLTNFSE